MKRKDTFIDRKGEKLVNNQGCTFTIIEYFNSKNCTIKFEDGTIIYNTRYMYLKRGNIYNPCHPSVWGKGYIGVGKYSSRKGGGIVKVYSLWSSMFNRCYSEKRHKVNPTYKDCLVDERWHNFQVFAEWFEKSYSYDYESMQRFELDKDILIKGNKIYSPETCCFVPQEINLLFLKRESKRGGYPIGVNKSGSKFQAALHKGRERGYLGCFDTPEEAFEVYKKAKEEYIKELAEKYKLQITEACYQALMSYKVEIVD